MLKKLRTEEPSASADTVMTNGTSSKGKARAVTIQEVPDDEEGDQSFAPGGDADYFAEEDEDGRFFGGGLTDEQKQILNIFDEAGENAGGDVSISHKLILYRWNFGLGRRTKSSWHTANAS